MGAGHFFIWFGALVLAGCVAGWIWRVRLGRRSSRVVAPLAHYRVAGHEHEHVVEDMTAELVLRNESPSQVTDVAVLVSERGIWGPVWWTAELAPGAESEAIAFHGVYPLGPTLRTEWTDSRGRRWVRDEQQQVSRVRAAKSPTVPSPVAVGERRETETHSTRAN